MSSADEKRRKSEYQKKWAAKNRAKVDEYLKEYRSRPESKALHRAANARLREKARLARAGRPRSERCEVCNAFPGEDGYKVLCLDHDHSTGRFRGWLCGACNRALGLVKDRPHVLRALADYLENGIQP